jgi:cyclopropane fatty-acyl-phospholipid synthase-like methyltransferase
MSKPFAPSADRNKQFILDALQAELYQHDVVFEFGSGTGQHICHFAAQLPDITWQPSDLASNLPGIEQWIKESGCDNIRPPLALDLRHSKKVTVKADFCYSANTLHIVAWTEVMQLFKHAADILNGEGALCVYGPFRFNGQHVSESNNQFDKELRQANAMSGIRNIEDLNSLAEQHDFNEARAVTMPANNHLMIWELSKK